MGLKLYLDENVPPLLAQQLRRRGFDVLSAHEVGMLGKSDEEQLKYASQNDRVLLTFDKGLIRVAIRWLSDSRRHKGIVVSTEIKGEQMGEMVGLCSNFLSHVRPEDTTDRVLYLQQFRRRT